MLGRLLFNGGESRNISYTQAWDAGLVWDGNRTWSGQSVSQQTALTISTVYAAIKLYMDTVSTLPAQTYIRERGERRPTGRPAWLDRPDVGVTWGQYVSQGILSYFVTGEWIARIYRLDGEVVALVLLDPTMVEVRRNPATLRVEYVWDHKAVIPAEDIIHITDLKRVGHLRGESRIDLLKQELGLADALTRFAASFFGNGSVTTGVIETPAIVTAEQAKQVKETYEAGHKGLRKAHGIAVLGGGSKFVKTSVDPDEAQVLESRAQATETIARIFRVPPPKLGITTPGSMSYASVEQLQISWTTDSIRPLVHQIETAHGVLLPGREFLHLNLDALLRGDTTTRYAAHNSAITTGWRTINEVRRYEDEPSIEGGDSLRVPLANVELSAANVVQTEKNVTMAVELINAGADPAETLAAFGLPAITFHEPEPMPEPVAPEPEDEPQRMVRNVVRDEGGFITAIIDEEL